MSAGHAELLRRAYPQVLARTLAFTRSLPSAEDAVQEAMLRALAKWPASGAPESPVAWLTTVAANVHRDQLRKGRWEVPSQDVIDALSQMSPWARIAVGESGVGRGWKDELLRLVFACCHPELEPGEGAALCLATVMGLSTDEVAQAFVTQRRTMEQRLARARKRLREHGDADGAEPGRSRERLPAVLIVIHLLFNEGYWSTGNVPPIRAELCRLALGLCRSLVEAFAHEAEALGLLALLLFHEARREARSNAEGAPVPLPEQDRSRYDRDAIREALSHLERAHELSQVGPFQLEAAISGAHCLAPNAEQTDWQHIAELYARLEGFRPSPAVRVNRAFALARARDARAGLALLESGDIETASYPYVHLVRGTLLAEIGELAPAREQFQAALRVARNPAERAQIQARIQGLNTGPKFEKV